MATTTWHDAALVSALRTLWEEGTVCDVALAGNGGKLAAHQVVLAAASAPLREYFLEQSSTTLPELHSPPTPLELELEGFDGLASKKEIQALLDYVYGGAAAETDNKTQLAGLGQLARALGLPGLLKASVPMGPNLAEGIRSLRSEGSLCDVSLLVGTERILAHQAVLLAAGGQLRRLVLDGLREMTGIDEELENIKASSELIEVELPSNVSSEALRCLLDHLYCEPSAKVPTSEDVCRDVQQLASAFQLPELKAKASYWLDICQEEELPKEQEAPDEPEQEGEAEAQSAEQGEEEEEEAKEQKQATKLARAPKFVKLRLSSTNGVPPTISEGEEASLGLSRSDSKVLEKLREIFSRRAALLPGVLCVTLSKKLPSGFDQDTLDRVLPLVAYEWVDGPWRDAYCRRGWDPREAENAAEALPLQVVVFRDPIFKVKGAKRTREEAEGTDDISFKHPPVLCAQLYQLVDIKDDFVELLWRDVAPEETLSRRNGWRSEVSEEITHQRLEEKSRALRDKLEREARRSAEDVAARKGKGGPAKRARH